jgi:uncharacterized protein YjiS (DUF1127 family)
MTQARELGGRPIARTAIGRRVADITRRAWSGYWTHRAERATVAVLGALDDRTLKDIGLERSEIESVVRSTHPGERRICWAPLGECGVQGCC